VKPPSAEPPDRERFLAAVAEHVPLQKVVELYLFQPIRHGGVESGVAVIAAAADAAEAQPGPADGVDRARSEDGAESVDVAPTPAAAQQRYTVFTARYRHVLKGPERGRWEVSVVAEADAPLATVSAVVRGVQRRAGDVEPPEHLTGDALRDVLRQAPAAEG
jgi:hypothetical protein